MFDVGFTEIVLILGLALLVLGPEKLPGLAQKIGRWTGRARAMARQLRAQLEQEVTLEELAKYNPTPQKSSSPTSSAQPADEAEGPTQTGFDLDQHFAELETSPEAMHAGERESARSSAADNEPENVELKTTPEAMHEAPQEKAAG